MYVTKVIGFEQFTSTTLANASAVSSALLTDGQGQRANGAWLTATGTTGAVRLRDDGTAPTAAIGIRIPTGLAPFLYTGNIGKLQFIKEAGNASLDVTYVQVSYN